MRVLVVAPRAPGVHTGNRTTAERWAKRLAELGHEVAMGERYAGEEGLRSLRRLAERQVKRELEPIKGVAAVQVRGGLEEEIHVRLDRAALARSALSPRQIVQRLAEENVNVAGGTLEEGSVEYMVRTLNEYTTVEEIAATIVSAPDGRPVRLGDLGEVAWAHATTYTAGCLFVATVCAAHAHALRSLRSRLADHQWHNRKRRHEQLQERQLDFERMLGNVRSIGLHD